jgi:hypothetical protein
MIVLHDLCLQPVQFCEEITAYELLQPDAFRPDLCGPANIACRRCNFKEFVSAANSVALKALVSMCLMSALRRFTLTPALYHSLLNGEEILLNLIKAWPLNIFMASLHKFSIRIYRDTLRGLQMFFLSLNAK